MATLDRWIERMEGRGEVDLSREPDVLSELVQAYTPADMEIEIHSGSRVRHMDGELDIALSALLHPRLAEHGSDPGVIERRVKTARRWAWHQKLELPPPFQDQLRGRLVLRRSVDVYRDIGIDNVGLIAVDAGRYVWAAAGFSFKDAHERDAVTSAIRDLLAEHAVPLTDLDYAACEPYDIVAADADEELTLRDWWSMLDIEPAEEDVPYLDEVVEKPGKLLLLAESTPGWEGRMSLEDRPENLGLRVLYDYTDIDGSSL